MAYRLLLAFVLLLVPGCDSGGATPGTERPSDPTPGDGEGTVDGQGNGETDALTDEPSADGSARPDAPSDSGAGVDDPAALREATDAALDAFFDAQGGRDAFPEFYVTVVEAMLRAEDDVAFGDFAAARARVDSVFETYPLSDGQWWEGVDAFGLNVGTPVAYYGLRMLDYIASVGLGELAAPLGELRLSVVVATCADGRRPTDLDLEDSEAVSLTVDERLSANDGAAIHQSTRLFGYYVWALTGGRYTLDVEVVEASGCAAVTFGRFDNDVGVLTRTAGLADAAAVVNTVSEEVRAATDMWWVIYPSNVPVGPPFESTEFVTGGMGGYGAAPMFIVDDLWLLRTPPHLGTAVYDDVQRRVYLPQWLQHEFFHHLYRTYPEFELEAEGHQWFDRSTWPGDFVGAWEPDYYAESVARRLETAEPPLYETLRVRPPTLDGVEAADFVGRYERRPVQNEWHEVTIAWDGTTLSWANAAGVSWELVWDGTELSSVASSPYGRQILAVDGEVGSDGALVLPVRGLWFNGELHVRLD